MRTAILYICTGQYNQFFADFYKSCERYLLKGLCELEYFVWTDDLKLCDAENVHLIEKKCAGFPADSLFRFEMFLQVKEQLRNFDYIYFFNANAEFVEPVGTEILPDKSELVAAKWPSRENQPAWRHPYERNKKSLAYIAPFHPPYHYYMGGINGGTSQAYLEMVETCAHNIRIDYDNGIVAVVHDESHINRYLREHACKVIPREYCWPEEWKQANLQPKIIFRDKVKVDPYFNKGRDQSFFGNIKKAFSIARRAIMWYI